MVEEKNRFRKVPINYAMKKNDLLKEIVSGKKDREGFDVCGVGNRER